MAFNKSYALVLAVAVFLTFLIVITPVASKWELWSYDYRLNLTGNIKKLDDRIRIIGIDEESLAEYGQWPWPRTVHARLVDTLSSMGAKAIAFDILFDNPDRSGEKNDIIFAQAVKKSSRVILPFKFERTDYLAGEKVFFPVSLLKESAAALGFADYEEDIDAKVRRTVLVIKHDGKNYPSVDLVVLAFILNVKQEEIKYLKNKIILGDYSIPTDESYAVYINYLSETRIGTAHSNILEPISYKKILDLKLNNAGDTYAGIYKSGIYYIGGTAKGFKDYFSTPVGYLSGLAIHANILNSILHKKFIIKLNKIYEIAVWVILGIVAVFLFPRLKAFKCLIFFIALLFIYTSVNFYLFGRGYWLNLVNPLVFLFLLFTFVQVYQFMRTHRLFGQFVAQEVVDEMLAKEYKQKLGGQEKEVTILFSDIRGYTNLSEKMNPRDVMELLNDYHSRMSKIFSQNKGRIFDYQGDAQMVVFGAPIEAENHAYLAVKAASHMRTEIEKIREEWKEAIPIEFNVGIGICTGTVAIGLVGAEEHKQYSAIGNSTNVAARLQGLSSQLGSSILLSEATYRLVKDKVTAKVYTNISVKGKAEPLTVYGVIEVS